MKTSASHYEEIHTPKHKIKNTLHPKFPMTTLDAFLTKKQKRKIVCPNDGKKFL